MSNGVFWIDPNTGAVHRSELRAGENLGRRLRSIILVSYARNDRFDMLLPDDMNELYSHSAHSDRGSRDLQQVQAVRDGGQDQVGIS